MASLMKAGFVSALLGLGLLAGPSGAGDRRPTGERCDLATRAEAEKVLREPVTGVVTGETFCTWLSDGPVLVAAVEEFSTELGAVQEFVSAMRRLDAEGKTVSFVERLGDGALWAVGAKSIELTVLDGRRLLELAVAGDGVELARYEQRLTGLAKTLLGRETLTTTTQGPRR